MAKMSDFGKEMLVTNEDGVTFDLNKDYTKAKSQYAVGSPEWNQLDIEQKAKVDSKAYGGAHKTGANKSASMGTSYNKNNTAANRTSTSQPIQSEQQLALEEQLAAMEQQNADLSKYLEDMYASNMEAEIAALNKAYDQNVSKLEASNEKIAELYRAARNQTAAQNALEVQRMNEFGVAQGLGSGSSGQMALAQSAAYQNSLGNLYAQEAQQKAEAERSATDLAAQYASDLLQMQANGNAQLSGALYNEAVRQQQAAATAAENARNEALSLLSAGVMPPAYLLAAAGMNETEAALWLQAGMVSKNSTGATGSASSSKPQKPTLTAAQVMDAIDSGIVNDSIRAAYEYYYGEPLGGETPVFGAGYSDRDWGVMKNSLLQLLVAGDKDAVDRYMSNIAGNISLAQWNESADLLNGYGYQMPKY